MPTDKPEAEGDGPYTPAGEGNPTADQTAGGKGGLSTEAMLKGEVEDEDAPDRDAGSGI